jgi:hypothetical protein
MGLKPRQNLKAKAISTAKLPRKAKIKIKIHLKLLCFFLGVLAVKWVLSSFLSLSALPKPINNHSP